MPQITPPPGYVLDEEQKITPPAGYVMDPVPPTGYVQKPPWYDNLLGLIRPILGGVQAGTAAGMRTLLKAADFISDRLGIPKSDAARMIARDLETYSQENIRRGVGGIAGGVASGIGEAVPAIASMMLMGPAGIGMHGAVVGGIEGADAGGLAGGIQGALTGAATGALAHGALKGMGGLAIPARVGAGAAFGAATTPGGIEERAKGAATMGALGALGGRPRPGVVDLRDKIVTKIPEKPTTLIKERVALDSSGINLLRPKIGPMDDRTIAVKQITSAIRATPKLLEEQKGIYRQAYGERFAAGEEAVAAGGLRGEEALLARKAAMKGVIKKVDYASISEKIAPEYKKVLYEMIEDSPLLTAANKLSAYDGLKRMLGDEAMMVPQPKQVELLHKVFGSGFTKALAEKSGNPLMAELIAGANVMRTAMSIGDLSMGFRQAVFVGARHPIIFAKNVFREQVKYFGKEKNYEAGMNEIRSRRNHPLAVKYGLDLMDVGVGPKLSEERMMGASMLERVPVYGKFVKASNRAYTGGLNKMRADLWDWYIDYYKRMGLEPFSSRDAKVVNLMGKTAKAVNTMTGRGPLANTFNEAAAMMNATLFSPRLISSRLHLMNPAYYIKAPKYLRKEMVLTGLSFLGAGMTTLGLIKLGAEATGHGDDVSVETNPTSSDFLKVKIGKTRLDIWGGHQQYAVFLSRILLNQTKSPTTGKITELGNGYKTDTRMDIAIRMFRYKMAPAPSLVWDIAEGKTGLGEPFRLDMAAFERVVPMVWQDMLDVITEDPGLAQGLMGLSGVFGLGVQTHKKRKK